MFFNGNKSNLSAALPIMLTVVNKFLWRPGEFFRISRFLATFDSSRPFVSVLRVAGGKWRENALSYLDEGIILICLWFAWHSH